MIGYFSTVDPNIRGVREKVVSRGGSREKRENSKEINKYIPRKEN